LWPERLLQVALNIRGMIDDTGTAPFYARARWSTSRRASGRSWEGPR